MIPVDPSKGISKDHNKTAGSSSSDDTSYNKLALPPRRTSGCHLGGFRRSHSERSGGSTSTEPLPIRSESLRVGKPRHIHLDIEMTDLSPLRPIRGQDYNRFVKNF